MNIPINYAVVEQKIISVRSINVILDFDVASLYGVETKHVNQAVRNNPEKFPEGYVLSLSEEEWNDLRSKILTANHSKLRFLPKAFTEKGLYMLATILKSTKATATTIAIVETFTNLRLLSGAISELSNEQDAQKKKSLMNQTCNLMNDLFGDELQTKDTETTFEFNFALLKLKHTIKRK